MRRSCTCLKRDRFEMTRDQHCRGRSRQDDLPAGGTKRGIALQQRRKRRDVFKVGTGAAHLIMPLTLIFLCRQRQRLLPAAHKCLVVSNRALIQLEILAAMTLPSAELFVSLGILPENVPPFTTKNLWQHFAALGTAYGIVKKAEGEHALYIASKRGGQRRIFGMPHPAFIRDAGLFYEKHWDDLSSLLSRSPGSASQPTLTNSGVRHVRINLALGLAKTPSANLLAL